ncbi:hypothetical protein SERLADRAFT_399782 [Serpula lacrymans var. lacrymans S7.9]|uniref:Uncharacterized protein n=1 Tax=Serpula lacrymans var. lacrymans (strain S7.9) TaxID=578457 RepID=F8P8C5_SERL9|nr:uncharacterized protein SERLADRAFT_399782 [Serpula lacrymans var. lacrymans S7.9]EGO20681.1 hypothetical protein SERLADRAFT_399782 [Serpula lacrymans var. lacrymans S7.9]
MCDSDRRARLCKVREWNGIPASLPKGTAQINILHVNLVGAGQHHGCAFIALV